MRRRTFLGSAAAAAAVSIPEIPDKTVVLTFDDAVKSHRTFVAPLLKELGFRASFFATHLWMTDPEYFMTWREIAEIHDMGFEIGNHTWTHADFSSPRNAARLAGEIALVENELKKAGVPKPVSFAYTGNFFGPEAIGIVRDNGFRFARRGGAPEVEYGTLQIGPVFEPRKHHALLIPTTGDAYPKWTLEHFTEVVSRARRGQAVILQFHGVPDVKHPWVHTPPENFRRYMAYLKDHGYHALALRDLEPYIDSIHAPADPLLEKRHRPSASGDLPLPVETAASRADSGYWLANMAGPHGYSNAEIGQVFSWSEPQVSAALKQVSAQPSKGLEVRPYPGGRPLRTGFREGAIDPLRGTKATVFLPWAPSQYVVIDLPEAIFSNLGLLFLAHTHIPTIWNDQNRIIENTDWQRMPDGGLRSAWRLPDNVEFGAGVTTQEGEVRMELWLRNGAQQPLSGLRTQICVLLKGASDLNPQTNGNKIFGKSIAAVQASTASRWVQTEWERCGRTWGNPQCPCMHSDPVLPDCEPGQTVRVRGRLWFAEGARPAIA